MDLITHSVVGAVIGYETGDVILGTISAILPDMVLGLKRKMIPNRLYNLTHSLVFLTIVGFLEFTFTLKITVALSILSHLVLDLPTHGTIWAPPLLYPFSQKRFSFGDEWEFFNASWYKGFALSFMIIPCLLL